MSRNLFYIDEAQTFNYLLITHTAQTNTKLPGLLSAFLLQGHPSGTNDPWWKHVLY